MDIKKDRIEVLIWGAGLPGFRLPYRNFIKMFESDIDKVEHMFYTWHCRMIHKEEKFG